MKTPGNAAVPCRYCNKSTKKGLHNIHYVPHPYLRTGRRPPALRTNLRDQIETAVRAGKAACDTLGKS